MQNQKDTPERPVLKLKKKRIIKIPTKKTEKTTATKKPIEQKKETPPPTPPKKQKKQHQDNTHEEIEQGRQKLKAHLNDTSVVWRDFKPLAIGIRQASKPMMKKLKVPRKRFTELLNQHCSNPKYLKNLSESSDNNRYKLDGTTDGEITPKHKQHAKERLQQINKKHRTSSQ